MNQIQLTITPEVKGKVKAARIMLEGELILRYLHEVIEEVKGACSQFDNITIELKNIINIDLACIQLLFSAKQTALNSKKKFTCRIELPDETKNMMEHAGLADLTALLNNQGI